MSLKDNTPIFSFDDHTELVIAVEDFRNGDRNAISRLQSFVERGIINNELYNEIIKTNEHMCCENYIRRENLNKEKSQKRKKLIRIILCVVLLLSLIASAVIYHLYAIDGAYADGYDIGKANGYTEGYDKGCDKGYWEYKKIKDEYIFYHRNAVIVTTTGNKYHRHGCYHIKNNRFYIFNIENAKYKGYTPCLDCFD